MISISRGQPVLAEFTIHTKIIFTRYFSTRKTAPTHTFVSVLFQSTFITPYRITYCPLYYKFMYPRYHVPYKICGAISKTAQKILTFPLTGPDFSLVIDEKSLLRPVHLTFLPVALML